MIHRLALLMGGTGAAGVLAVSLALGGFGSPLSNSQDAFAPVANDALAGGQRAAEAPTDQPTMTTSLRGGAPEEAPKKVIDTVYVLPLPAPAVDSGGPANGADQPRDASDDNNAGDDNGNQAGDEQDAEDSNDDDQAAEDSDDDDQSQAGEDDQSHDADESDNGGGDDGGYEPGDD